MMDDADFKKRIADEEAEAEGWNEVLRNFGEGSFSKMICPHCGGSSCFGYLLHSFGFTIRCQDCMRFTHARGGRPKWLLMDPPTADEYTPVPNRDWGLDEDDGADSQCD